MRVGGRAELLLEPATPAELVAAVQAVREAGLTWRVLGGGANLIVGDGVLEGAVISTERLRRAWRFHPERDGDPFEPAPVAEHFPEREPGAPAWLGAWAGESMLGLVRRTKELGWSGLEGLAGVPGHVGGGVAMNAGGSWGELWDAVERVQVLAADGSVAVLRREDCAPSYRHGNLGEGIVLAALFRFTQAPKREVAERVREHLEHKRRVQPLTEPSAGCIFVNPDPEASGGRSAGRLIDEAGLKGLARGDAEISALHGNFVVNRGRARAADVLGLIDEVRARVAERFGVELVREVKVWTNGPDRPA